MSVRTETVFVQTQMKLAPPQRIPVYDKGKFQGWAYSPFNIAEPCGDKVPVKVRMRTLPNGIRVMVKPKVK